LLFFEKKQNVVMKRTFLAVSALVLAIAGIAATKATKRATHYYYQKGSVCQLVSQETSCVPNATEPCKYVTAGGTTRNIFQNRNVAGTLCSSQLFVPIP
jgi:hypothetical protein